jgi:hypothetical protein
LEEGDGAEPIILLVKRQLSFDLLASRAVIKLFHESDLALAIAFFFKASKRLSSILFSIQGDFSQRSLARLAKAIDF